MNSQPHEESSEDCVNPPIFAPSHSNGSTSANIPPSFMPKRAQKDTQAHNTQAHNSEQVNRAPSLEPAAQRNHNSQSASPRALRTVSYSSTKQPITLSQLTQQNAISSQNHSQNQSNGNENAAGLAKPLRPRHFLHAFIIIVVGLLIACAGFGVYSWHWVDSHMNRTSWLTNTQKTQGTSWLILGSDQREGEEAKEITGFRTDTILVLTKPSNGHSSLISIPRDSLVSLNGERVKINSVAQTAGNKALTSAVENITGHSIDHVAEVRFEGLTNVVNALDGIDLCYNRTVSDTFSGLNWTAGCHHVDGTTALAFSRMRYADPESDFGRAARQRMVIAAIMKKALAKETITNFGKVKKIAEAGLGSILFDEESNPSTLWEMAQAFREATGPKGISGTVYWTNPDYQVPGVGSSVLLDDTKNLELFDQLASGSHNPGAVGTLAELQQ